MLQKEVEMSKKKIQIRNSTVDFLVFTKQNSQDSIEVRVQDENVWLTQEGIAKLFEKGRSTITEHLQTIFKEGELVEDSVCRNFRLTATDGKIEKSDVSIAKSFAESEFEKYRVIQDRLFESDFDKFLLDGSNAVTIDNAKEGNNHE